MIRVLLLLFVALTVASCNGKSFDIYGSNHPSTKNPADEVGGYPVPDRCVEKDPETKLCK